MARIFGENLETMLHYACQYNEMSLVKILIYSGMDTEIKDKNNYCARHYLSSGSHKIYSKYLEEFLDNKCLNDYLE